MAPLPKKRLSRQRGRNRLSGQIKQISTKINLTSCPNCHRTINAHLVCRYCGYYKGKKIITVSTSKGQS